MRLIHRLAALACLRCAAVLGSVLVLSSCAQHYPPSPHHDDSGFHNNYTQTIDRPFSALLRWKWEAWRADLPKPPKQATPQQAPDLAALNANAALDAQAMRPAITWIGHASLLVQAGGLNVLTDPIFSDYAFPVQFMGPKRAQPPGVALADLPPVDVVVISHNHYDHLDAGSIRALEARAPGKTLFLVPLGLKSWMQNQGVRQAVELDWWQRVLVKRGPDGRAQVLQAAAEAPVPAGAAAFYLTPVQHWSARSLGDRRETLWGGWAVFAPGFHWYFAGDTGYTRDFVDTRKHFASQNGAADGFDLALLPVGAYDPRWFMREQHMDPTEAVQAHLDLGAQRSVGMHWGTFSLTDEPLDQPPEDLARARAAKGLPPEAFGVMKIGETRFFPRRDAATTAAR